MNREIHTIDAKDQPLGRLASQIVHLLRGKHKPTWQPQVDSGDGVEIINVNLIKVTGDKERKKIYYFHSGHPGSLRKETYGRFVARKGHIAVLESAVYNMLPKNKMRAKMMKRLTFKQ